MTKRFLFEFILVVAFSFLKISYSQQFPQTPIPSTPTVRGLKDTVGFAISARQMDLVVRLSEQAEKDKLQANSAFIAAISPHDDYIYAGPVYIHIYPHLKAKRIVIFGVSHYARRWKVENTLIFDAFKAWRGPYGNIRVSALRDEILAALPTNDYLVSSPMQAEEHSVEALIPWLQYYNRDVEIVSILVPYMRQGKMDSLAGDLSLVLAKIMQKHGWVPGQDIGFLISNDCSHYGDQGWGGRDFAPFGADCAGLEKGTERDIKIAKETLCGAVSTRKAHDFYARVLDPKDYHKYQVVWCGRYAVPFGITALAHLIQDLDMKSLTGHFLRYGDSVGLGELDVRQTGMGVTAPANLHHWVGYVAIGYW